MFNLHANGRNIVGCYMLRPFAHQCQHGRNKSQHCWTNNVGSCVACRRIVGGRNLVRVRNIVVATIFDFMTVEDWGE